MGLLKQRFTGATNGEGGVAYDPPTVASSLSSAATATVVSPTAAADKRVEEDKELYSCATIASLMMILFFIFATIYYLLPPHSAYTSIAASAAVPGEIDNAWKLVGKFNQVNTSIVHRAHALTRCILMYISHNSVIGHVIIRVVQQMVVSMVLI
jgi:hypothetical protein